MVFVSVNMMSWNDYGLWSQKDPGASPAGSRHHFCPLKTLGNTEMIIPLLQTWKSKTIVKELAKASQLDK